VVAAQWHRHMIRIAVMQVAARLVSGALFVVRCGEHSAAHAQQQHGTYGCADTQGWFSHQPSVLTLVCLRPSIPRAQRWIVRAAASRAAHAARVE
jgi:hypothetical protein